MFHCLLIEAKNWIRANHPNFKSLNLGKVFLWNTIDSFLSNVHWFMAFSVAKIVERNPFVDTKVPCNITRKATSRFSCNPLRIRSIFVSLRASKYLSTRDRASKNAGASIYLVSLWKTTKIFKPIQNIQLQEGPSCKVLQKFRNIWPLRPGFIVCFGKTNVTIDYFKNTRICRISISVRHLCCISWKSTKTSQKNNLKPSMLNLVPFPLSITQWHHS